MDGIYRISTSFGPENEDFWHLKWIPTWAFGCWFPQSPPAARWGSLGFLGPGALKASLPESLRFLAEKGGPLANEEARPVATIRRWTPGDLTMKNGGTPGDMCIYIIYIVYIYNIFIFGYGSHVFLITKNGGSIGDNDRFHGFIRTVEPYPFWGKRQVGQAWVFHGVLLHKWHHEMMWNGDTWQLEVWKGSVFGCWS